MELEWPADRRGGISQDSVRPDEHCATVAWREECVVSDHSGELKSLGKLANRTVFTADENVGQWGAPIPGGSNQLGKVQQLLVGLNTQQHSAEGSFYSNCGNCARKSAAVLKIP